MLPKPNPRAGFLLQCIDERDRRRNYRGMNLTERWRLAGNRRDDPLDAFAYEAMQETAAALGRIGKQLEAALEAIQRHDATPNPNRDREDLLQEAADRVQALIIQREAMGLYASRDVQRFYGVPGEVMSRIGIIRPKRPD